jgi:hypothetical protein
MPYLLNFIKNSFFPGIEGQFCTAVASRLPFSDTEAYAVGSSHQPAQSSSRISLENVEGFVGRLFFKPGRCPCVTFWPPHAMNVLRAVILGIILSQRHDRGLIESLFEGKPVKDSEAHPGIGGSSLADSLLFNAPSCLSFATYLKRENFDLRFDLRTKNVLYRAAGPGRLSR